MGGQLSEGLWARIYSAEFVASLLCVARVLAFTESFYATIKWSKPRDVSAFKVLLPVLFVCGASKKRVIWRQSPVMRL